MIDLILIFLLGAIFVLDFILADLITDRVLKIEVESLKKKAKTISESIKESVKRRLGF